MKADPLCFQFIPIFVLLLSLSLWCNLIVLANPHSSIIVEDDSKIPLSKRILGESKGWRAPKDEENTWRKPKENTNKSEEHRIEKTLPSFYGPIYDHESEDIFPHMNNQGTRTKPLTLFKFRF